MTIAGCSGLPNVQSSSGEAYAGHSANGVSNYFQTTGPVPATGSWSLLHMPSCQQFAAAMVSDLHRQDRPGIPCLALWQALQCCIEDWPHHRCWLSAMSGLGTCWAARAYCAEALIGGCCPAVGWLVQAAMPVHLDGAPGQQLLRAYFIVVIIPLLLDGVRIPGCQGVAPAQLLASTDSTSHCPFALCLE